MKEVFMPYENDIRDLKDDIRDEGITSTTLVCLAMFAVAAVVIWFVMATH
jgi:hypothetical protein